MDGDADPLLGEQLGVGQFAVGEHLLLVLILDLWVEFAGALLGGFDCSNADAFIDRGAVGQWIERGIEIDKCGGHLSPVAEFEGALAETATGNDGDGVGGAAIDLYEGNEALAVGGARIADVESLAAEHCEADAENLAGTEVAMSDFCLAEEVVEGLHGSMIRRPGAVLLQMSRINRQTRRGGFVGILWKHFALGFSALLPLVNPLGSALVILGIVGFEPPEVYKTLARKIAVNMLLFLAVVELVGSYILEFFGVSLAIVQCAGGMVISAIGWSMLNQKDADTAAQDASAQMAGRKVTGSNYESQTFYPLMFPVTAGPGCIVVMLTLSAHASESSISEDVVAHLGLMLAVAVLSALVYVCYASAPRIAQAVSPSTAHGIVRVIAFILLCIGVQIAWNGLEALLRPLINHQT